MADAGARSGSGEWEETSVNEGSVLTLYPVPVSDELHLNLEGFEGKVALMIHNAQGRSMHTDEGEAEKFREYSISTSKLGMISGIYFVQVRGANGKRIVQKFVKL